jgi:hypothetical protein
LGEVTRISGIFASGRRISLRSDKTGETRVSLLTRVKP